MRDIKAQYDKVSCAKDEIGGVSFFSRDSKKAREWHVLGAVQQLLVRGGLDAPAFAEESETPDFHTFLVDGKQWTSFEVVEILRPDYRRQEFYARDAAPDAPRFHWISPPLGEPWQPLRDQVQRKAAKSYPIGTSLIVYYDIGRLSLEDWHTPFHEQLLSEHSRSPLLGADSFDRVLVLSADMECLVQIHPEAFTIVPDVSRRA